MRAVVMREKSRLEAASVSDLTEVCGWIRSAEDCRLWLGARLEFPIDAAKAPAALEFDIATSWKLVEHDKTVAFGQIVPKERARLHFARLIVEPERRGTGFGRLLVRALLDVTKPMSGHVVSLNVIASNTQAIGLYRSFGFVEVDRPADEPASTSIYLERST
jgi:ribosomal protein S18 acetylase RimI-like enzyme